jgi:5'-3' exonuclease
MPKRIILIDGDQFLFKAAVAVEKETQWDDVNHVLYSNPDEAWSLLTDMISRIFDRFETREHALTFSADPNFRKVIDPTYKLGRSPRKPLCYALLREKVEGEYNCVSMPGLEADDVMGILATKPGRTKRIIVSQDKDMRTIPVDVWNGKDLYEVTPDQADRFHLYQTLIGDTSDGYSGCPGVGPVAAEHFLSDPHTLEPYDYTVTRGKRKGEVETRWSEKPTDNVWEGICSYYAKAGLTPDDALKQARLARILRWDDWDKDKKEPILWTPPST